MGHPKDAEISDENRYNLIKANQYQPIYCVPNGVIGRPFQPIEARSVPHGKFDIIQSLFKGCRNIFLPPSCSVLFLLLSYVELPKITAYMKRNGTTCFGDNICEVMFLVMAKSGNDRLFHH